MADGLAWVKFLLENRKILFSLIILLFPSLGASLWGNYRQSLDIDQKQSQIKGQQKQIIGIAEQAYISMIDYSKIQKMIDKAIKEHERKFH